MQTIHCQFKHLQSKHSQFRPNRGQAGQLISAHWWTFDGDEDEAGMAREYVLRA